MVSSFGFVELDVWRFSWKARRDKNHDRIPFSGCREKKRNVKLTAVRTQKASWMKSQYFVNLPMMMTSMLGRVSRATHLVIEVH